MTMHPQIIKLLTAFAVGYLPGLLVALVLWIAGRKSNHPMPLFQADLISFIVPVIVWLIMYRYEWTFASSDHEASDELAILGWVWSLCVVFRGTVPRLTHKLRFRMAAIHVGSICTIAAILLALFYQFSWK